METKSPNETSLVAKTTIVVAAIVALIIGGMFVKKLNRERLMGKESLNWPQIEGLVVRSEYNQHRRNSSARISYRYEVNGKEFISTQVDAANDYMIFEPKVFVDNHPAGTKIPVYYNVNDPSVSVLFPGIARENTFCLIAFGVMLLVTGVSSVVLCVQILRAIFRRPTTALPSHG